MKKSEIKLDTLRQVRELVESNLDKVHDPMDTFECGECHAYDKVLSDIRAFEAIIKHTETNSHIT